MLGKDDAFVFENGHCSFRTSRGVTLSLNDRRAWQRPLASIGRPVVGALAAHLEAAVLHCRIEVIHTKEGFVFRFLSAPQMLRAEARMFEIRLAEINAALEREGSPAVGGADKVLNTDGQQAIKWILETLTGVTYTIAAEPDAIRWCPPPKPEGYAPLTRTHGEDAPYPKRRR